MNLRAIGAALALCIGLSACVTNPDGSVVLNPDARTKLETASKWAHRVWSGAGLAIIGIKTTCSGKTSDFCAKAMPIVEQAGHALTLYDAALAKADAALAASGTPEEQLVAAAAGLIELEADVEDFIRQLRED